MRIINISKFSTDDLDKMADMAKRRAKLCKSNESAVCMTLHPEGFPALAKSVFYAEKFSEYKTLLKRRKIHGKTGILLQSLLGHGRSGEQNTAENWQRAVNINGNSGANMRMCMLDKDFRNYIKNTIIMLAKNKPDFFLVDDDVRLINGALLECFCPLHVAEYNQLYQTNHSQESLRSAIKNLTAEAPEVQNFDRLRRETLFDFARLIRSAIDEVDPDIPCGYCTPGYEFQIAGTMAKILAGKNPPFLRCNNALYAESDPKDLLKKMAWTGFFSQYYHEIGELLIEADTCPFSLYSKSVQGLRTQIAAGILNGMQGAKVWTENIFADDPATAEKYQTMLGKNAGLFAKLQKLRPALKCGGVISPGRFSLKPFHPLKPLNAINQSSWQYQVFNLLGIPARIEGNNFDGTVALSGLDAADFFTDSELKKLLKGKLLLDGGAALALAKRGFSKYLGVNPQIKELRFHKEKDNENNTEMMIIHHESMPYLELNSPKTEVLSTLVCHDFYLSKQMHNAAHGCTFFQNELKGKVIVTAMSLTPGNYIFNPLNNSRRNFWLKILTKLNDGAPLPLILETMQPVFVMHFYDETKLENYASVVNLGFDPLETLEFKISFPVKEVQILAPNGNWRNLNFEKTPELYRIKQRLNCCEFCFIKF